MPATKSPQPRSTRVVTAFGVAVTIALALASLLLTGGAARAAGTCSVPSGARSVANVAGVHVWWQKEPTPGWVRRRYGAAPTYPNYSGCVSGRQPAALFRDYSGDNVSVRVAGDYVGLLDRGGMESLYLSDMITGRTTSTKSFTPSVQDIGGSEANEPGPLISWTVTSSGWLVYLDGLSDLEGYGTALVAMSESGATTLDLVPNALSPSTTEIGKLAVTAKTVSWWSRFSGTHQVTLGQGLLPAGPPKQVPTACQLVPRSLAQKLLGPLSATSPPAPHVPPAGFWPRVRTGTNRSSCAYASATDPAHTINIAEQRVTPTIVRNQQRATGRTPRADGALVLPGDAAMLFDSRLLFSPKGREDLRLFINDIEVDVTTNYDLQTLSNNTAREIETVGLAIERALHDAPPAASHV